MLPFPQPAAAVLPQCPFLREPFLALPFLSPHSHTARVPLRRPQPLSVSEILSLLWLNAHIQFSPCSSAQEGRQHTPSFRPHCHLSPLAPSGTSTFKEGPSSSELMRPAPASLARQAVLSGPVSPSSFVSLL